MTEPRPGAQVLDPEAGPASTLVVGPWGRCPECLRSDGCCLGGRGGEGEGAQGRRGRVWGLLRRGRAFPTEPTAWVKALPLRCHDSFGSPLPETEGMGVRGGDLPGQALGCGWWQKDFEPHGAIGSICGKPLAEAHMPGKERALATGQEGGDEGLSRAVRTPTEAWRPARGAPGGGTVRVSDR